LLPEGRYVSETVAQAEIKAKAKAITVFLKIKPLISMNEVIITIIVCFCRVGLGMYSLIENGIM
tara:strand:+ start:355 stop:546 length:192 start_codon:yes stop_codon:yes gene_type:complete